MTIQHPIQPPHPTNPLPMERRTTQRNTHLHQQPTTQQRPPNLSEQTPKLPETTAHP
ncbi:hypothetical protein [Suttonella ornithocola]|uniref:hypothetical protein n=1 Tax=Suttonella ornithocola TaxID=279832 RepID=UPI001471396C|nr:hypothetical protein [Suttonella ornithocola]